MANDKTEEKDDSTGATFSLIEVKKDRDDLEMLDGTKVYFKSITDFDDVDFLEIQKKIKAAELMGKEISALAEGEDGLDEKQTQAALKKARVALDGVLKVILVQVTDAQLKDIGGIQIKMKVIAFWTENNIGKKAPGQQD